MQSILEPLAELKEFQEIQKSIENNISPVQVTGCMDSQKSHLIAGLGKEYPYKVIIAANDIKAKEIYEDYRLYDRNVFLYPAKDAIFYSADVRGNTIVRERLQVLKRLIEKQPTCIITKTVKGKGVSFMENQSSWHGTAPNKEQYEQAMAELNQQLKDLQEQHFYQIRQKKQLSF